MERIVVGLKRLSRSFPLMIYLENGHHLCHSSTLNRDLQSSTKTAGTCTVRPRANVESKSRRIN